MGIGFFLSDLHAATDRPYGDYRVWQTDNGIGFQLTTHHPGNLWMGAALALKSGALAFLFCDGFWNYAVLVVPLLVLDALLYFGVRRTRLTWIEVRPDGFAITPNAARPKQTHFFDQRGIEHRTLEFDTGLVLRYGIHDVHATSPFVNEREFEVFRTHFEQVISRLWYQQNL